MSNTKYKVGDRVKVKSLDWYNKNKNSEGVVKVPCSFTRDMSQYCGREFVIVAINSFSYTLKDVGFIWSDEMFEGLVEEVAVFDDALGTLRALIKLRDEYWRVICDGWKPDYTDKSKKYCITTRYGRTGVAVTMETNRILVFPNRNITESFYKKYKKDIDKCKDLL